MKTHAHNVASAIQEARPAAEVGTRIRVQETAMDKLLEDAGVLRTAWTLAIAARMHALNAVPATPVEQEAAATPIPALGTATVKLLEDAGVPQTAWTLAIAAMMHAPNVELVIREALGEEDLEEATPTLAPETAVDKPQEDAGAPMTASISEIAAPTLARSAEHATREAPGEADLEEEIPTHALATVGGRPRAGAGAPMTAWTSEIVVAMRALSAVRATRAAPPAEEAVAFLEGAAGTTTVARGIAVVQPREGAGVHRIVSTSEIAAPTRVSSVVPANQNPFERDSLFHGNSRILQRVVPGGLQR